MSGNYYNGGETRRDVELWLMVEHGYWAVRAARRYWAKCDSGEINPNTGMLPYEEPAK